MIGLDDLAPALQLAGAASGVGIIGGALALGLRHGIDWDHIAAITDITSTAAAEHEHENDADWLTREPGLLLIDESHHEHAVEVAAPVPVVAGLADHGHAHLEDRALTAAPFWQSQRRPILLGTLYALGHGAVVIGLGLLALVASSILPDWIDPIMGRLVGVTLLLLAGYLYYSVYRYLRGGEFQMRSRWMLLFLLARNAWGWVIATLRRHPYHQVSHARAQYGPRTAFGIGAIHGVGAETGTQVLLIAAATGASNTSDGIAALFAFVTGVLISNSFVTVATSAGFVSASKRQWLYVGAGILAATFSLVLGLAFVLGQDSILPDLDLYLQWIGGPK